MHPHIKPLASSSRKIVFLGLLLLFLIVLPLFIFYATGYRYDFSATTPTVTVTGAFYILADTPESTIYLDETLVTNVRSFRNASYIQGVVPGLHRVHVQAPGTHTWVKALTVSPRIVTEAEAFNLPLIPQVRLVPAFTTVDNRLVVPKASASSSVLSFLASSTPLFWATSTATSTYRENTEYTLLNELFIEQASTTALRKQMEARAAQSFGFATSTIVDLTAVGTTTVTQGVLTLYASGADVYARAEAGNFRQVPFYFCNPSIPELTTADPSVATEAFLGTTSDSLSLTATTTPACRSEIRLDRQGKTVVAFHFFPANANLVLLHLVDGVYVTEIDDRAWQNTQPLYLGEDLRLLLYREGIYIKERELIFEVLPEITNL